jgi:hypothetical protein
MSKPMTLALALGAAVAHAATPAELTAKYAKQQSASCAAARQHIPQLPAADQAAFMAAYQAYDGTDPNATIAGANKVLANSAVSQFLSAADSFGTGGADAAFVTCIALTDATPAGLADYAAVSAAQEATVDGLLADPILLRDMILGGSPQNDKYAEAAGLYAEIKKASKVLSGKGDAAYWDDRSQTAVLERLALGTALAFAVPLIERFGQVTIDPVQRYLSFEKAYQAGDLDTYFEVLSVWELRFAAPFDGSDDDMAWLRETMPIVRPEHIAAQAGGWRYSRAVRTDVAYGDSVWPDGVGRYRDLPAAGAVCGGRAFFGRFCRHSWGLPTLAFPEPGHGSLITWTQTGWTVELGAPWRVGHTSDSHGSRSGSDFKLEADAREFRGTYQKVLRGLWAAQVLGETPVSRTWSPVTPTSYGTGGNWSALSYAAKVASTQTPAPERALGTPIVPTKTAALTAIWDTKVPTPTPSVGPDGSITIPAAGFSYANRSSGVAVVRSLDGVNATHVEYQGKDFLDPASTAIEYTVESADGGSYWFSANISTWHVNNDLQLTTNTTTAPISIPVFYTVGVWKETQPVQVTLVKGTNVLRFVRQLGMSLVLKEFFLLESKPVVPPPPGNYTPAPAPPAVEKYIQLHTGLTCTSQGILDLDGTECSYASAHFGFKDTGTRSRDWAPGCWGYTTGPYAGNANLNANAAGTGVPSGYVAMCLRS